MADERDEFKSMWDRMLQGDEQAAKWLYEECLEEVIMVIRFRLKRYPQLRRLFDSTWFYVDAWHELLNHPEKLRSATNFKHFLHVFRLIALHKIEREKRKNLDAQKRDLRRDRPLSDPDVANAAKVVADWRPYPMRQAESEDEWQHWLAKLPPHFQSVALLLRDGYSYQEIADKLHYSVRSIERFAFRLRLLPLEEEALTE